ncbi:MAG TPA: hypothetical protein V6D14_02320 [Coleofasciculaceae cyanobacterium]|jgi:hypothetical protein
MATVLVWGLVGCGDRIQTPKTSNTDTASKTQLAGQLSEVAPPPVIQQLSQNLEAYQPQVTLISPKAEEVLQDTKVSVQIQVQDLPIFKDPDLGMGPHLHVILDNQPYKAVYDIDQPLVFEDLTPGTHTLRVFASRPWHESFKNEGAYAQTTFHVFTKTPDNNPDSALPLLTYSRPTGSYGAEPIMLDFYLNNAPLHLVAQESPDDEIADWRIRVTINGESFVLDRWQPIYLKGFKSGKNWVQLEFLDEQGNPLKNVFNNTVRLVNYEPKGKDTLSKLVRGELSAEAAIGIVDPNYKVNPTPTPSPTITPTPSPSPELIVPEESEQTPQPEASPTPSEAPTAVEEPTPPAPAAPPEVKQTEKPKFGGFFNRFRRPAESPSPSPELVVPEESEQTPQPEASPIPSEPPAAVEEPTPPAPAAPPEVKQTEKPKSGSFFNRFRRPVESPTPSPELVVPEESEQTPQPEASPIPSEPPAALEEPTPPAPVAPPEVKQTEKPKFGGFFNRFRRPAESPTPSPELPEVLEAPTSNPTVIPEQPEITPPEELVTPSQPPTGIDEPTLAPEPIKPNVEPSPVIKPIPIPIQPEKPKSSGLLERFKSPASSEATPDSSLPPTLPEIVETPFPKPSEPEAAFPEPAPSVDSQLKSSPTTAPESRTTAPESRTEEEPTASSSESSETPNPESTVVKPKLDLNKGLLSPPTPNPSPRIIQVPADVKYDIPSRFLKKSKPDTSTNVPEPSEVPAADSDAT